MIDPQQATMIQEPTPVSNNAYKSAEKEDSTTNESVQATSTEVNEGSEQQNPDMTPENEPSQEQNKIEPEKKTSIVTFPKQVGNAWGVASKAQSESTLQSTDNTNTNAKKRSNTTILSEDTPSNNGSSKPKFADIMAEQESQKVDKSPAVARTKVSFSSESEEERMMRLAIEASLKDQQNTSQSFESHATKMPPPALRNSGDIVPGKSSSVSFSNTNITYDANDDMDDDMRIAIALSLQEAEGGGYANDSAVAGSFDFDSGDARSSELEDDRKPSAFEMKGAIDDRKPSALPKGDDDLKPAAAEMKSDPFKAPDPAYGSSAVGEDDLKPAAVSLKSDPFANSAAAASSAAVAAPTADESEKLAMALHEAELAQYNASVDANAAAEAASLQLAMQLQQEEDARHNRHQESEAARLKREEMCHGGGGGSVGVRTVSRDEFNSLKSDKDGRIIDRRKLEERGMGKLLSSKQGYQDDDMMGEFGEGDYDETGEYYYYATDRHQGDDVQEDNEVDDGEDHIRMNSQSSSSWKRLDRDTFIGPGNEIRTKHDTELKHRSNASKISHGSTKDAAVSDRAYNAFKRAESRQSGFKKGVAKQGHGRAEVMGGGKTRGGAIDGRVLEQVNAAINSRLIETFNGVVKEGKEAMVYHADGGKDIQDNPSEGYDVAVKVFKRIAEFKGRGSYVDGDPRYHRQKFKTNDQREQVVLWTEKEYRNLIRAHRAGVAVPTPLHQKENILFMRFLGENGWPSPQLKEIDIRKGSKKWTTLYCQTLVAVRRLYHCARLIHADLSEYNLLVCPFWQTSQGHMVGPGKRTEDDDALQIVLIDFGQAVEVSHPSASSWLKRDLSTVRDFFVKQGIKTLSNDDAELFVTDPVEVPPADPIDDTNEANEGPTVQTEMQGEASDEEARWRHNKEGWDDVHEMESLLAKLQAMTS